MGNSVSRRYRFHEWLSVYSESERKKMIRHLRKSLGVSRVTLNNWLDLRTDASFDVPYKAVQRICEVLGHSVQAVSTEAPTAQAA